MGFWNNALKYGGLIVVGIFALVAISTNILANLSSFNKEQIEVVKLLIGILCIILLFIMFKHNSNSSLDYYGEDIQKEFTTTNEPIETDLFSDLWEKLPNPKLITINGVMYVNKPFVIKESWREARSNANTFNFEGYKDWRLPTVKELIELGTNQPLSKIVGYTSKDFYIKKEFLDNLPTPKYSYNNDIYFWTSETKTINNSSWLKEDIKHYAYTVNYHSKISEYIKTYSYTSIDSEYYVIYVRDI